MQAVSKTRCVDYITLCIGIASPCDQGHLGLAKRLGTHKNVLGRYERNEVFPSIDIARKIADILEVFLDYLTGKEDVQIDKATSKRILKETDRNHIFSVIDAFITKRKIQSIL